MQSTVVRQSVQPTSTTRRFPLRRLLRITAPLITFAIIISIWQIVAALEVYPSFLLPPPADVIEKFYEVTIGEGRVSLWVHLWATLQAVLGGLLTGLVAAVVLGYMIAKIPLLEDFLSPIVVAFQATPVVAYAPLLVIWFGSGIESKVITSALIVFFPTLMNTIVGVRSVPGSLTDLMRSLNATPRQTM
ncbi:MAG: ABC transporter permease subunit, partial [Chloroflexota bacterium]